MSHRFPPLASPRDLTPVQRPRADVAILSQTPSLPWFELGLTLAMILLLQTL